MLWIGCRSINAQERVIDQLKKDVEVLEEEKDHYTKYISRAEPKGAFYLEMQQRILADPAILKAWSHFLVIIKLTSSHSVKGITHQ